MSRRAVSVVVLPAIGGSAATSTEARRDSIAHRRAISSVSALPDSIICIMERGTGGCQCQPHQPNGSSRSSILHSTSSLGMENNLLVAYAPRFPHYTRNKECLQFGASARSIQES